MTFWGFPHFSCSNVLLSFYRQKNLNIYYLYFICVCVWLDLSHLPFICLQVCFCLFCCTLVLSRLRPPPFPSVINTFNFLFKKHLTSWMKRIFLVFFGTLKDYYLLVCTAIFNAAWKLKPEVLGLSSTVAWLSKCSTKGIRGSVSKHKFPGREHMKDGNSSAQLVKITYCGKALPCPTKGGTVLRSALEPVVSYQVLKEKLKPTHHTQSSSLVTF